MLLILALLVPFTATTPDAAIAELRERQAPATLQDLAPATLAPELNAAVLLQQAVERAHPEQGGPRSSALEYGPALPYPPEWHKLAEESLELNDQSLALVRQARKLGTLAWTFPVKNNVEDQVASMIGPLSPLRHLANVVADAALLHHFRGRAFDALQSARDHRFLADAVGQRPFLVSAFVSLGIRAQAVSNYHLMGTELRVPDDLARDGAREAITWLLDERVVNTLLTRVLHEERVVLVESLRTNPEPLADLPATLDLYDQIAERLQQPQWQPLPKEPDGPAGLLSILSDSLEKTFSRLHQSLNYGRAHSGAAAISLAAGLYRHDHGKYPESLQQLVPEYLPRVPADPFARDGAPLRYVVLEDGTRPLVGTVGPDGRWADAEPPEAPSYQMRPISTHMPDDGWADLSAWRP